MRYRSVPIKSAAAGIHIAFSVAERGKDGAKDRERRRRFEGERSQKFPFGILGINRLLYHALESIDKKRNIIIFQ